jgi:hypothetical protein
MNPLTLSKTTHPLLTIFWQVSLIALIVFVITFFTATDPFFRGFNLVFFPLFAFVMGFTVVSFLHTIFTPGGFEYHIKFSFGSPVPQKKAGDPLTENTANTPLFRYESNESFSFGRRR